MDSQAIKIVNDYIRDALHPNIDSGEYDVFITWKCKTLQNWKYLISTTLMDGLYYELTYNGDKREWYLDVYRKAQNIVIPQGCA